MAKLFITFVILVRGLALQVWFVSAVSEYQSQWGEQNHKKCILNIFLLH